MNITLVTKNKRYYKTLPLWITTLNTYASLCFAELPTPIFNALNTLIDSKNDNNLQLHTPLTATTTPNAIFILAKNPAEIQQSIDAISKLIPPDNTHTPHLFAIYTSDTDSKSLLDVTRKHDAMIKYYHQKCHTTEPHTDVQTQILAVPHRKSTLACNSEIAAAREFVERINQENTLKNRHILITAGPTREALDPVTYLTNPSSGKTGLAFAKAAIRRAARVTLVLAQHIEIPPDLFVDELLRFTTVAELEDACMQNFESYTDIFMAAAVGDCERVNPNAVKIKKRDRQSETFSYEMRATRDVLVALCNTRHQYQQKTRIYGFAAETTDLDAYAAKKLVQKGCDAILANWVSSQHGNAFGSDQTTLYCYCGGNRKVYGPGEKYQVAGSILDDSNQVPITLNLPQ